MNVGEEKVVLKSGAEDLTGMYNLKKGMMGTTGDTNKGDEEFIKRHFPNMFVVKFIFNQKYTSDYALVDGKYVQVVVEKGKNLAAKKRRRPKRSKRRPKRSKVSSPWRTKKYMSNTSKSNQEDNPKRWW